MTTQDFLNTQEYLKNYKNYKKLMSDYDTDDSLTLEEFINYRKPIVLEDLIKKHLKGILFTKKNNTTDSYYIIKNEEVLNFLRDLWLESKNSFVKNIIVSVGRNRKSSNKQLSVICKESVKHNIELRFIK